MQYLRFCLKVNRNPVSTLIGWYLIRSWFPLVRALSAGKKGSTLNNLFFGDVPESKIYVFIEKKNEKISMEYTISF